MIVIFCFPLLDFGLCNCINCSIQVALALRPAQLSSVSEYAFGSFEVQYNIFFVCGNSVLGLKSAGILGFKVLLLAFLLFRRCPASSSNTTTT